MTEPKSTQPPAAAEVTAITKILEKYIEPRVIDVTPAKFGDYESIPVLLIPEGMRSLDLGPAIAALRGRPDRRKGTAKTEDLDSFIAHVNRHKDENSVVFADPTRAAPKLTAIHNYNIKGGEIDEYDMQLARFGDHRTVYAPALSDEYKAWSAVNGQPKSQSEFAEFIEDRITDIIAPPDFDGEEGEYNAFLKEFSDLVGGKFAGPSRMMELARGVKIHANQKVDQLVNLSSGEGRMSFSDDHTGADGAPLTIPNLFLIVIPIFYNGTPYRIPVRLRYRLAPPSVKWWLELYRIDRAFDAAFDGIRKSVESQTELPVFLGSAEA